MDCMGRRGLSRTLRDDHEQLFWPLAARGEGFCYTGRRNYTVWPPAHDDINGSILGPQEIALTFDDAGSHTAQKMIKKRGQNSSTLMLLDALDAAHISAGFFVNSDVDGQLLLSMAMRGHLVGSHADNHDRHFPDVPSANFSRVLRRVERVFMDWLHQKPVLIRAPFGEIDARVLEVLHDRHYLRRMECHLIRHRHWQDERWLCEWSAKACRNVGEFAVEPHELSTACLFCCTIRYGRRKRCRG